MSRSSTESRIQDISLSDIDRSRNHRIPMPGDAERIEALKSSIEACGQLQPVRVYERGDAPSGKHGKPFILGFGERRCAAVELLGHKTVRAVVFGPAADVEIAQARAIENLHRQDITPLEEVRAVLDVLEAIKAETGFAGDPHEEAATRLARSVVPVLAESIGEAIQLAFKGRRSGWIELLADSEQADPDSRGGFGIPHPSVLEWIGRAVGIELPPVPQWTPPVPPSPVAVADEPEAIAA